MYMFAVIVPQNLKSLQKEDFNMTDLSKGIIEINGFTIKPDTTLKEMQDFFGDKVRVLELSTGPRLKLQQPYFLNKNIYAYAFNFKNNGELSDFSLIPEPPVEIKGNPTDVAEYMLKTSKQWLKEMIDKNPTTDCNEGISYHFNNFHISAFIQNDIHYGKIGGYVSLYFNNEA